MDYNGDNSGPSPVCILVGLCMFATELKVIVSSIYMSFTIGRRVRRGQEANKPPSLPLPGDGCHSSLLLSPGLSYENLPSRCKLTHCRRVSLRCGLGWTEGRELADALCWLTVGDVEQNMNFSWEMWANVYSPQIEHQQQTRLVSLVNLLIYWTWLLFYGQ